MSQLAKMLQMKSIVILVGAGGVGKTTTSVALSLLAAKLGRRVGLISIDPAKRLATAMGISLTGKLSPIALPEEFSGKGKLFAAMLDQQGVFDSMVDRFAPTKSAAAAIKSHSFYHAASQNLAGALEFMALAKLQEMIESDQFDLVIVDTPPDAHALDFLARPDSLARFVDSKVTTWMLKPFAASKKFGLGKWLNKGEKFMGGIAKVAGLSALQTMSEFLIMLQDVLAGFNRAGTKVAQSIRSEKCSFVMVTAPRAAPTRAAVNMMDQLKDMKLNLDEIVVNRCLPTEIRSALSTIEKQSVSHEAQLALILRKNEEARLIESLKATAEDRFSGTEVHLIDELSGSIDNLAAVARISKLLE